MFVNLRLRIPERLLQLNGQARTVQATNNYDNLKVYLYFSAPVLNSSAEILDSLNVSQGLLLPTSGNTLGNRRFSFLVKLAHNFHVLDMQMMCLHFIGLTLFMLELIPVQVANVSRVAIVTMSLNSNFIISRQGTPVSSISPVTFLYGTNYICFANLQRKVIVSCL